MIRAIIFDLDGTLLNTISDLNNSINKTYKALNIDKENIEDITMARVGHGIHNLIEQCFPTNLVEEAYKIFLEIYDKEYDKNTAPYKDIKKLIDTLIEKDIKVGVNSNKNDLYTKHLIEIHFPSINQDYVLGHIDNMKVKPDPEGVNLLIKKMDVLKEETIYVGDSPTDIKTAINAGIDVLSVTWGFRSKKQLIEANAKHLIDNPKEILDFIC